MNQFQRKRARERINSGDVNLAKTTISRNDDLPDELRENFGKDDDGNYVWTGDNDELSAVRSAMRDYEKNEARVGEDKSYYDARYKLQFLRDD